MRKVLGLLLALVILFIIVNVSSAISATGTITGRIVSTSIDVQNITFNDLEANPNVYYYKKTSGVGSVTLGSQASDIIPFANLDFALDSGTIRISIGDHNVLPHGAKIIIDDDKVPSDTSQDSTQVQITGDSQNQAVISYGDSITFNSDGELYVFVNTGTASSGNINVDIVLESQ